MNQDSKNLLFLIALGLGLILGLKYLFPLVAPFLLGITFAGLIEPLVHNLEIRWFLRRSVAVGLVLTVLIIFSLIIVFFMASTTYQETQRLLPRIPHLVNQLGIMANQWQVYMEERWKFSVNYQSLPFNQESLAHILRSLIEKGLNCLTWFPQLLLVIVLGGVTAYYFSRDKKEVGRFCLRILPASWYRFLVPFKKEVLKTIGQFLRLESGLVLLTGTLTAIILKCLGIPGALAYGFIAAILDLVPVLGIGLVYLPMAGIQALLANYQLAAWLVGSYFMVLLIRQIAEIKLIGENLKLHPLFSIMVFYLGMKVFGIAGIIFVPILIVSLRAGYQVLRGNLEVVQSCQRKLLF